MRDKTTGADQAKWKVAVDGLLAAMLNTFFPAKDGGIFQEITCEKANQCNFNEILFKGVTSSWLSFTAMLVPETYNKIMPALQKTAVAAAQSCSGKGSNVCGIKWYTSAYDGTAGMEQQISASDAIISTMVQFSKPGTGPVTSKTGGNSSSDPNAGNKDTSQNPHKMRAITTGDKVGAVFMTLGILGVWTGGLVTLAMS